MSPVDAVPNRYVAALRDYMTTSGEVGLLVAYELGREFIGGGVGLLDVVRLHAQALAELEPHIDGALSTTAGPRFLGEVLAPYEMAYLGFQEAITALQEMTSSLEAQVTERTRAVQDSLSRLQAIDAERRHLLERIVTAQEQERHRIADDLHDDTIQVMTAVGLRIALLRRHTDPAAQAVADKLEHSVSQATDRLRRLVFELRPPALDDAGLGAAIRMYLRNAFDEGPKFTVDDRLDEQPPIAVREVAYRICQEALANVRRHAGASHVHVEVVPREQAIWIRIEDDGAGFDPAALSALRPGHLGITAMRERAQMMGGTCRFHSQPGGGTTVEVRLPVTRQPRDPASPSGG